MAFPFAMNECSLAGEQEAINLCFSRNDFAMRVYFSLALVTAVVAVALHLSRNRWTWPVLIAVPIAPIVFLVIGLPKP